MNIITALWIFAAVCFLLPIISGLWKCYGPGRKIKILLKDDETGRTTRTGIGHSYGSAAVDLCYKLYASASTSKISSIQDRIDSMNKVISEYKGRMNKQELKNCEEYLDRLQKYIKTLQERAEAEKQEKQREQEERRREAEAERKRKEAEKKQAQMEKEKTMSEKKRYIAAQRRLMTDSLRYDVMNRDGFRCVLCGASPKTNPNIILHVDHIIPLAKGGKTEMTNLRTLCERCNLGKRDKIETGTTAVQLVTSQRSDNVVKKQQIPEKDKKTYTPNKGKTDILDILKQQGVSYVDNRKAGGALWVKGGHELDNMMKQLKTQGHIFIFSEKGGKATKGCPAWWYNSLHM